jgi:hypothetical protein
VANKNAMQRKRGLQNTKKLNNICIQHENKTNDITKIKGQRKDLVENTKENKFSDTQTHKGVFHNVQFCW